MTHKELVMLQALPLEAKIAKSKCRIDEFIRYLGKDSVYIAFSGGIDSTVLLYLAREVCPELLGVYCHTGLEFPEILNFVKSISNIITIRPTCSVKEVLHRFGYPVTTKEQAEYIYRVRNTKSQDEINKYLYRTNRDGTPTHFYVADKWLYLTKPDAPKVSSRCCHKLKMEPFLRYEKQTGCCPLLGLLAEESQKRTKKYLDTGCNAFNTVRIHSMPLGFWTRQDILAYLDHTKQAYCPVYGSIEKTPCGQYHTTGEQATGCIYCGCGCHLEKGENRYQRLQRTHPVLHKYCMEDLGFKEVLEYIGIDPYID